MDIEIDNDTPDFKCVKCKTGLSIYIEEYWEGEFYLDCPVCNTNNKAKRELIENIKLCK
tara:strand:+ start:368 stop:544 length:177 start_codon:yes stop_codon:yes gene_type:complete